VAPEQPLVPDGFAPVQRGGSFLRSLGTLYVRTDATGTVVAMRVEERHLNSRGIAHGGFLVTLVDTALAMAVANAQEPGVSATTANLTADFIEVAKLGDFVEARVDLQKVGRRLVFASCQLSVGERRIVRASGVFARQA
jgi:uncharacterized protein (TIGR00369 family)